MEKQKKEKKVIIKNEISLKEVSPNYYILNRNGHDLYCPFVPPTMIVEANKDNPVGHTVGASRQSCSSMCPLFSISSSEKDIFVKLSCGQGENRKINKLISNEELIKESKKEKIKLDKNIN